MATRSTASRHHAEITVWAASSPSFPPSQQPAHRVRHLDVDVVGSHEPLRR
jgi:hypothetical protein